MEAYGFLKDKEKAHHWLQKSQNNKRPMADPMMKDDYDK